ncbi:MAG: hypothetical protein AAFQ63_07170 [Cyanobacteria bacterium J06621_11]
MFPPAEVNFSMRNHDTPAYHQMLKLGLGLGVLHIFCAPALAESDLTELTDQAERTQPHAQQKTNQALENSTPVAKKLIDEPSFSAPSFSSQNSNREFASPTLPNSRDQTTEQSTEKLAAAPIAQHWAKSAINASSLGIASSDNTSVEGAALRNISTDIDQLWKRRSQGVQREETAQAEEIDQTEEADQTEKSTQTEKSIISSASAQALSVREIDALELNWQEVEITSAEAWFGSLSASLLNETNETAIETESVTPAPAIEHVPAFTQPATESTTQGLSEGLDSAPTETAPIEIVEEIESAEAYEKDKPNILNRNERLASLQAGSQSLAVSSPLQANNVPQEAANTDPVIAPTITPITAQASPEVIGIVEGNETSKLESTSDTGALGRDLLSEVLENHGVEPENYPVLDEELGTLRMVQLRSRENEELGILRALQTAQAAPPAPTPPIAYLGGRLGFVDVDNVFRTIDRFPEEVYQAGLSLYLAPRLSENTSLYAIAETNIARYNNISQVNYNELQVQLGIRQRLLPRTFAQIGWRNQRLYSPGYREKLFGVQYLDALVSHRSILTPKTWVDGFYQMRLGFADPQEASRFRQTFTVSFNYGISQNLRTSLLYQLDFDDYTQINRHDTYQQLLGIVSYNLTPESRLSVFGGTRFGRSSEPNINLDDTFYGAGLNVNVPLF